MQGIRLNARYRLTIYYKNEIIMQFSNASVNYNIDFDVNIIKDGFGLGNTQSSIFIYNLSSTKRNSLESLISESRQSSMQLMIEVSLPYGQDQYQIISYDDIIGVYNELGEADFKTNLILKSGEASAIKQYASSSYPPGATLSEIMNKECQTLVDDNSIKGFNIVNMQDYTFPYGLSYVGNTVSYLKKLAYQTNNAFFIDRGIIYISQSNWMPVDTRIPLNLNYSNGLIEPPHVGQLNYSKKYNKKYGSVSFQFKSLLLPDVDINGIINVLGSNYTIKRINHTIQSRQGIAYSVMEGFKNDSV